MGDSEASGQCSELIPLGFRERQIDSSGGSVSREETQEQICNPKACSRLTELVGLMRLVGEREPHQSLIYSLKKGQCPSPSYQQIGLSWSECSRTMRCLGRSSKVNPCWEVSEGPSSPGAPRDLSARSLGTVSYSTSTPYHPLLEGSSSLLFIL